MHYGTRWLVMALAMIAWLSTTGWAQTEHPDPEQLAKAVEAIENLDAMRSGLAATFEGERRSTFDGAPGVRYFRRITVEPACLACHGAKAERPAFVQKGYPDDRAYDFQVGDLRGIYAVFIPDTK